MLPIITPLVDFVGVEGHADGLEQHDSQASAQMLAELVEPAQHGRVIAGRECVSSGAYTASPSA